MTTGSRAVIIIEGEKTPTAAIVDPAFAVPYAAPMAGSAGLDFQGWQYWAYQRTPLQQSLRQIQRKAHKEDTEE